MEQITLYFKQGSSNKVYQAGIEPKDGGYVVNFAFGRRGATLQTGTKTQAPVGYDEAKKIYDSAYRHQMARAISDGVLAYKNLVEQPATAGRAEAFK